MDGLGKNIWIIANWKSNKNIQEALDWVSKVGPSIPKLDNLKVVVCPTSSCLSEVKKAITVGNFPLMVGSQNLSPYDDGAYTGEESASLLSQLVELSIIGHSERRENFKEDDEMIAGKVDQASKNNITPLLCVQGPDTLIPSGCKLVAYEPIFAIGSGNPDSPENANNVASQLKDKYVEGLEILYGGSLTSQNAKSFIMQPNLAGFLIGKASLDAMEFVKIISECEEF